MNLDIQNNLNIADKGEEYVSCLNLSLKDNNSNNQILNSKFEISSKSLSDSTRPLSSSKYTLPKRKRGKRIFEEFLSIGIESNGLEYIDDIEELLMTPKITHSYPNKLNENEMNL